MTVATTVLQGELLVRQDRGDCRVYWGSHGCDLRRHHAGSCVCDCAIDYDELPSREDLYNDEAWSNVGAEPYYGPGTVFYGEDAAARGLPTSPPLEGTLA